MADDPDNPTRYYSLTGTNEPGRFIMELEFVQCLASPHYLNWLAQNKYFEDKAFLNYLKYLEYWRKPEYAKYIRFPHCLFMLELLQHEHFRKVIADPKAMDDLHTQQYWYWQHYQANRIREAAAAAAAKANGDQPTTVPGSKQGAPEQQAAAQ